MRVKSLNTSIFSSLLSPFLSLFKDLALIKLYSQSRPVLLLLLELGLWGQKGYKDHKIQ